jgi:glyoxylase-like metal-dependent hydrolase (beta-lactamase superfamily II)
VQVSGAGGNVLVLPGDDGLLLVDSGAIESSAALAAFLSDRFGGAPVRALFNTHWHLANTGGNDAFGPAGAQILAHENTRLWMSTEFYVEWQDKTYQPRAAEALPNDTFYSHEPQPLKLGFGSRQIEYGHLREAHTDGDIYVFFPEDNVLAVGGVMAGGGYPIVDFTTGGWIGGLEDATQKLIDLSDAQTRIIPESGPVQTRAALAAQHEMLVTVRGRIENAMRQGKSAEEMLAEGVTREFDERWGNDPRLFVSNIYDGLWWAGRLSGSL